MLKWFPKHGDVIGKIVAAKESELGGTLYRIRYNADNYYEFVDSDMAFQLNRSFERERSQEVSSAAAASSAAVAAPARALGE